MELIGHQAKRFIKLVHFVLDVKTPFHNPLVYLRCWWRSKGLFLGVI